MGAQHRIEVHLRDPTTPDDNLCRLYWERPPTAPARAGFTHPVTALAARFGLSRSEITTRVGRASYATMPEWPCDRCGCPQLLYNRGDYESHVTRPNSVCKSCTLLSALANFKRWEAEYAGSLQAPRSALDAYLRRQLESQLTRAREMISKINDEIAQLPSSHAIEVE